MKSMHLLGVVCSALALSVVGCEKKESPKPAPKNGTGGTLSDAGNALKDAAKNAGGTVDQVAKEAKDKAVALAQDGYDAAKRELDDLSAKVASSTSAEKPMWERAVDGVKTQFAEMDRKLSDLRADNSDWKKISEELSALATKARTSIQELAAKVK